MVRKRILFVDDDGDILIALSRRFRRERSEWETVFARGPDEALALLQLGSFDVVVSDLLMPGMRGDELLRRIGDSHPETYRILLTGSTDAVRSQAVADCLLSKPCNFNELRATIGQFVMHGRGATSEAN